MINQNISFVKNCNIINFVFRMHVNKNGLLKISSISKFDWYWHSINFSNLVLNIIWINKKFKYQIKITRNSHSYHQIELLYKNLIGNLYTGWFRSIYRSKNDVKFSHKEWLTKRPLLPKIIMSKALFFVYKLI